MEYFFYITILMGCCFYLGYRFAVGSNIKMAEEMIYQLQKEGIVTIDDDDQVYAGHKTKEWAKAWRKK